ncbi:hypothetical protein NL676_021981 [Syzygium grande]|nr:hypothetical protein NL676_021981 [Syzygium grande]
MGVGAPELAGDEDLVAALNEAAPHGLSAMDRPSSFSVPYWAAVSNWRYPASMAPRQAEVSTSSGGRGIEAVQTQSTAFCVLNSVLLPLLFLVRVCICRNIDVR